MLQHTKTFHTIVCLIMYVRIQAAEMFQAVCFIMHTQLLLMNVNARAALFQKENVEILHYNTCRTYM